MEMLFSFILTIKVLAVLLNLGVLSADGNTKAKSELNGDVILNLLRGNTDWAIASTIIKSILHFDIPESSRLCVDDLTKVAKATLKLEEWALFMLDAFGKPGSGILDGNLVIEGNYKECINIKKDDISGKYCWVDVSLDTLLPLATKYLNITLEPLLIKELHISLKAAICIPSSCATEIGKLSSLIKEILGFTTVALPEIQIKCVESPLKDLPKDTKALIAIGVLSIFLLLVIIGTCVDLKGKHHMTLYPSTVNHSLKCAEIKTFDEKSKCEIAPKLNRGLTTDFLMCFSAYSNAKKLFQWKQEKHLFLEINGLRTVAMAMIIYLHSYYETLLVSDNTLETAKHFGYLHFQFLFNIFYVDVFFTITGFLTLNSILQKKRYSSILRFIFNYVTERYLRMALPSVIFLLVFYTGLTHYLGYGPHWANLGLFTEWWRNILFNCNWSKDKCIGVWWFLAASLQLHVLSLFIVVPIINKKYWLSVFNGGAILIWSWCWLFRTAYQNDIPPSYSLLQNLRDVSTFHRLMNLYLFKYGSPFYHYGSYCSGMLASWILFRYKDRIILNKVQMTFSWLIWCVIMFLLMTFRYYEPDKFVKSVYVMLGTTIIGLCVAWLLVVCLTNNGGVVSAILRWKLFVPLSKMTMTVYLTHWLIISHFYHSEEALIHFSGKLLFAFFLRNLIASYVIAIPLSLIIEAPMELITNIIKIKFLRN